MKLRICYHGTSRRNAAAILKIGFKPWTYFAKHLEDALGFGGRYIFEVAFPEDVKVLKEGWQFRIRRKVSPKRIIRCKYYCGYKVLFENKKLGKKIFDSNQ